MKTSCVIFFLVVVLAISFAEATYCPGTGFYPDPSNCQGFTLCYGSARGEVVGVGMKCPPLQAFDRDGGYCSRSAFKKFC